MTKGTKYDSDKARIDLIPASTLFALGEIFRFGSEKYGDHNWRKGIKNSRLFAAVMRHMWQYWGGETLDKESGESHLWHAITNISMMIENDNLRPELDDRYAKEKI